MRINGRDVADELYVILDPATGSIYYTRGGSSTSPKMMAYPTGEAARRALRYAPTGAEIRKLYEAGE